MRILTRKKGNKKYFYLQHSLRKGKKVVTKEKYLGIEIPDDINEITSAFRKEMQSDINKKLEKIKEHFQSEWKRIPESAKEKELEEISISFTYNTNAIEGSTIALEDAREIIHDKISPNKPLRDVKETEAHSKVFLEMLKEKSGFSNELILRWHKNIFGETKPDIAGRYREHLVRVGNYRAPDWQDVQKLMNGFLKVTNESKLHPVELSARAHYQFEKIHPFGLKTRKRSSTMEL
ncbi:MAG: hypothetical protein UV24_C0040G0003 [Candidatus Nomurabacteria bacterium GW2011_GWA2_42_41]|nr:MAG: hypothetical protein UV24_C0040G0003 [Candidatus Nomurabacteria bacterium GW2011_GWA2_42_41]